MVDVIGGLVGGFLLTWIAMMLVKNAWLSVVLGFVVTMVVFWFGWLGEGMNYLNVIAAVVGALVGYMVVKGKGASTPPSMPTPPSSPTV